MTGHCASQTASAQPFSAKKGWLSRASWISTALLYIVIVPPIISDDSTARIFNGSIIGTSYRITIAQIPSDVDLRSLEQTMLADRGRHYSHTLDPRTGYPINHCLSSITVVANNAMHTDGLATGLLVLGPEAALRLAAERKLAVYLLIRNEHGFSE